MIKLLTVTIKIITFLDLYHGYKNLSDGWVTLFNGYQYKPTSGKLTWNQSRKFCQNWGSDLAVYGIQNMKARQ